MASSIQRCFGDSIQKVKASFSEENELKSACDKFKHSLEVYAEYVRSHAKAYIEDFPLRIASYWDPIDGDICLKRDIHLTGTCNFLDGCLFCLGFLPLKQWSRAEYLSRGAFAFGLFDNPRYRADLQKILYSTEPPREEIYDVEKGRTISLGEQLDTIFDTYLAFVSVESMQTERDLGRLKDIFARKVSNVSQNKLFNRLNKDQHSVTLSQKDVQEIGRDIYRRKEALKKAKADGTAEKPAIVKCFEEMLQETREKNREAELKEKERQRKEEMKNVQKQQKEMLRESP